MSHSLPSSSSSLFSLSMSSSRLENLSSFSPFRGLVLPHPSSPAETARVLRRILFFFFTSHTMKGETTRKKMHARKITQARRRRNTRKTPIVLPLVFTKVSISSQGAALIYDHGEILLQPGISHQTGFPPSQPHYCHLYLLLLRSSFSLSSLVAISPLVGARRDSYRRQRRQIIYTPWRHT